MKKFLIIMLGLAAMIPFGFANSEIKEPNVSGKFYDADPKRLAAAVDTFINRAEVADLDKNIAMIIAPHAGYIYSGAVAGYSFKAARRGQYKTIVIIAPSHFYGFDGISIWPEGGFQTPLGIAPVDHDFTQKLIGRNEKFYFDALAFEQEHALEVEIPFLQRTFSDFKIVPVVMGQPTFQTCEAFAAALKENIGERDDVLVVVSTDLSHYHDDTFARAMDQRTLAMVKAGDAKELWKQCRLGTMEMCGFVPVTTALLYAKLQGLRDVEIARYANSGDVTGDRHSVVGYASVIFYSIGKYKTFLAAKNSFPMQQRRCDERSEEFSCAPAAGDQEGLLSLEQKKKLLSIARKSIENHVRTGTKLGIEESDPRLFKEEGAFVTIHRQGRLRGCIGNIIGQGPLYLTVRDMAITAASRDPRFQPVSEEELKDITVEVSVLSEPKPVKDMDEIVMGVHGVIVSRGAHHGVFLPQVATETGWSQEEFLAQLCEQKAGLPRDCWKDHQTRLEIFTAQVFAEKDINYGPLYN